MKDESGQCIALIGAGLQMDILGKDIVGINEVRIDPQQVRRGPFGLFQPFGQIIRNAFIGKL